MNDEGKSREYLESVDWELYLEREQPLFLFAMFTQAYGPSQREATGIGFEHQLNHYQRGLGAFYRSEEEMERIDHYFAALIDNGDPRIDEWLDIEEQIHQELSSYEGLEDARNILEKYLRAIIYNPVINYRLQSAFKCVKKPIDERLKERIEKSRTRTFYPYLTETVMKKVFRAVAERLGVEERQAQLLTPDEIIKVLYEGSLISNDELKRREEGCYFYLGKEGDIVFYYGEIARIARESHEKTEELKGVVACKGYAKGKARIINSEKDVDKMEEGDILVSINTNPSIMAAIRKAAGIVTNEGGVTCHAAIISRELNIPCVIGTKTATRIFKDGDLVEVDADNGTVRRIP
jgi:phosphohistidine swiveling domain-containing protein